MSTDASARAFTQRLDGWYELLDITSCLFARTTVEVPDLLARVDEAARSGLHAAGFVSYDAAPAFDAHLRVRCSGLPPACFLIGRALRRVASPPCAHAPRLDWRPEWTPLQHEEAVRRVKDLIAAGDTYQVNLTFRQRADWRDEQRDELLRFCLAQPTGYGLYLEAEDLVLASVSPELFFQRSGRHLLCRPMKGTAARGRWAAEDRAARDRLAASPKDRAENLMIVDMVRNDLGRIARTGTVKTTRLFEVERYPTVWQLTSTVEADSAASLPGIFSALFPSASVTGAPKVRTMEIIRDLEVSPRGLYTGAAGWVAPGGDASFNVSIRTLWVDRAATLATYGTGGGIVWDSDAASEYAECVAKTRVLSEPMRSFCLLETLKWEPGEGYALLSEHLDRLTESADYFAYELDRAAVAQQLQDASVSWSAPRRVRLIAGPQGSVRIEDAPLSPPPALPTRVAWAPAPVHSSEIRLYHKTTDRQIYDEARRARPDCDDVLLWNERGELCEATVANVAVRIGGEWITPPLSCGLLPGVMRRRLLETGRLREAVIPRREIAPGTELALFNSVRGWCPTRLVQDG